MSRAGTFAYICEDCQEKTFLSARERSSRFRPRCSFCGSAHLHSSPRSIAPERMDAISHEQATQKARREKIMNIKKKK